MITEDDDEHDKHVTLEFKRCGKQNNQLRQEMKKVCHNIYPTHNNALDTEYPQ